MIGLMYKCRDRMRYIVLFNNHNNSNAGSYQKVQASTKLNNCYRMPKSDLEYRSNMSVRSLFWLLWSQHDSFRINDHDNSVIIFYDNVVCNIVIAYPLIILKKLTDSWHCRNLLRSWLKIWILRCLGCTRTTMWKFQIVFWTCGIDSEPSNIWATDIL